MNLKKNKAFTLVELIVVITILAILWTIAFLSFQWYSRDARDSARSSDLDTLRSSLELFYTKTWFYPQANNWQNITYSWIIAWQQWTFWDPQNVQVGSVSKLPKDPLTQTEYTYSVTSLKNEYQLAATFEWKIAQNIDILNKTYAWNKDWIAKIIWNYNWVILPVYSGSTTYILAVPTIINWDMSLLTVQQIISGWKLVTNWWNTLPPSYSWTTFDTTKTNTYYTNSSTMLVYSWTLEQLKTNETQRSLLVKNIQDTYSWTIAWNTDWNIQQILNTPVNVSSPTQQVKDLWFWIVTSDLKVNKNQVNWSTTTALPSSFVVTQVWRNYGSHTCALWSSWKIKCWWRGSFGQLWDWNSTQSLTPVEVTWITNATYVSGWDNHTCALLADKTVKCWWRWDWYQLWNWIATNSSVPVVVTWLTNVVSLSVWKDHACAILSNWTAKCWWSNNTWWRLWNGDESTPSPTPTTVIWWITNFVSIASWRDHNCAITSSWTIWCWWRGSAWQLWNSAYNNSVTPVQVTWITNATQVTLLSTEESSCALLADKTVTCWWGGWDWELWDWTFWWVRSTPLVIPWLTNVIQITWWNSTYSALLADWTVKSWWLNDFWQLWDWTTTRRSSPVSTLWLSWVTQIASWRSHICAIISGWTMKCFWLNSEWQLWDWTIVTPRLSPVDVIWL